MSAASSRLLLESPITEQQDSFEGRHGKDEAEKSALEKLTTIDPPTAGGPVIAIDLDDVLSQTNQAVADWHNAKYGTNMNLSSFYYYYYWKNPLWGTPKETFIKVKEFYSTDLIYNTKVVLGAREGVQALRNMGFRLIIVTARTEDNADESWEWVNKHFPGLFDSVICTGQFKDAHKTGHEVVTKLSKAQVCADLGAKLLIDDSAENALQCATSKHPTPVLLFGDYQWNKRISGSGDAKDEMAFDLRLAAEGGREFWKGETITFPESVPLQRAKDWSEVVRWVQRERSEGRL